MSLKRSQQQADKQRLEESKKLNSSGGAETNGDIYVSKSLTFKVCRCVKTRIPCHYAIACVREYIND